MRLGHTIVLVLYLFVGSLGARAEIGLLLSAKPNVHGTFVNEITGAGHSGVYLSRVCPESPVKLRLCQPGELGSVIQNYQDYKEDDAYEWNAVPLSIFLYGVEDPHDRPLFGSPELRRVLQEQYRQKHLQAVCRSEGCMHDEWANWRDSVAAAFVREIYIFQVDTTVEQDEQFIQEFNTRANVNHYNGFLHNCADFAKLVVNTYFPHSARRNILNDVGMTGPKAIARSFTHYAERHPELNLQVIRIEQLPGTYKRSSDCHEGTEQVLRSKKWLIPVIVMSSHAVPVLAASYFLTGRFNPDKELREHPSQETAALQAQLEEAHRAGDKALQRQLKSELRAARQRQVGTREEWKTLRDRFDEVLQSAIAEGIVTDSDNLRSTFRDLQARGHVYLDDHQQLWLEVEQAGAMRHVGLSYGNILSAESDARLRLQLLLARTDKLLSASSKHRELYTEFEADWALLRQAEQAVLHQGTNGFVAAKQ